MPDVAQSESSSGFGLGLALGKKTRRWWGSIPCIVLVTEQRLKLAPSVCVVQKNEPSESTSSSFQGQPPGSRTSLRSQCPSLPSYTHVSHVLLGLPQEEQRRDVVRYATSSMLEELRRCLADTIEGCIANGSPGLRHVFGGERHTPEQLKAAERGQVFCLPRDKDVATLFWEGLASRLLRLLPPSGSDCEVPFHVVFKAINQKVRCWACCSLCLHWLSDVRGRGGCLVLGETQTEA